MSLKQYLGVYREFIGNSFSQAMSFRVHFVLLIVMDLLFYFSSLASVDFIFNHVERIGPWNRDEFLFFVSFMLAVDHLHMTFISESFWTFSYEVRTGRLDFILLKPIGALFNVFFRFIRPASLCNIFVPWACMFYFGNKAEISGVTWILIPPMLVLSLTLLVSLEILLSMSMFWVIESFGINFLRMQFQQMARWPDFVYRYFARKTFTIIIPILLIGSAPVRFLFDQKDWPILAGMIAWILLSWWLIKIAWHKGLKRYESASS